MVIPRCRPDKTERAISLQFGFVGWNRRVVSNTEKKDLAIFHVQPCSGYMPAEFCGEYIRAALFQKPCATANSGRKVARLIGECVDKILLANLKIETAIAAANTGCQQNIALFRSLMEV